MSIKIMVTAVGGGVGQSVLRALKASSLDYIVIGTDIDPWAAGLYSCDSGYLVDPAGSDNYREQICEICKKEKIDILIPGSDPELPELASIAKRLKERGTISILGSFESVAICRDKEKAYSFFSSHNLPFIKTLRLKSRETTALLEENDYPLIIKPAGGSASQNVHIVFNPDELDKFRRDEDSDFIVQEYLIPAGWNLNKKNITRSDVEGGGRLIQKDEISIQVLLDARGAPFAEFTSFNSLKDGVPMTIDPQKGIKVEETAKKMAEALGKEGLIGPCNLQCKLTGKGPHFFEINPRFTGITAVRARIGFNEVEAMIRMLNYNESTAEICKMLDYRTGVLCSRYITEYYMPRQDFEMLKTEGSIESTEKGFGSPI